MKLCVDKEDSLFEYRPDLKGIKTCCLEVRLTDTQFEYRPDLKGIKTLQSKRSSRGARLNTALT